MILSFINLWQNVSWFKYKESKICYLFLYSIAYFFCNIQETSYVRKLVQAMFLPLSPDYRCCVIAITSNQVLISEASAACIVFRMPLFQVSFLSFLSIFFKRNWKNSTSDLSILPGKRFKLLKHHSTPPFLVIRSKVARQCQTPWRVAPRLGGIKQRNLMCIRGGMFIQFLFICRASTSNGILTKRSIIVRFLVQGVHVSLTITQKNYLREGQS